MSDLRIKSFSISTTDNVLEDFNRAVSIAIKHFDRTQIMLVLGVNQVRDIKSMGHAHGTNPYMTYKDGSESFMSYPIRRSPDKDKFEVEPYEPTAIDSPLEAQLSLRDNKIIELESIIAAYRKSFDE